jgi:hypothetical protein
MNIEIKIELALVNEKAPLRALADVILLYPEGEITLRRCAVFEKAGGPPGRSSLVFPSKRTAAGARRLQERVLEVMTRVMGEEHPDTLTSMLGLGFTPLKEKDVTALGCRSGSPHHYQISCDKSASVY